MLCMLYNTRIITDTVALILKMMEHFSHTLTLGQTYCAEILVLYMINSI